MFTKVIIFYLITNVLAQFDGNFWWLNDKLAKYVGDTPSQPTFEKLTEFNTDEADKIIFRENELNSSIENTKIANDDKGKERAVVDSNIEDGSKIFWPSDCEDTLIKDDRNNDKYKEVTNEMENKTHLRDESTYRENTDEGKGNEAEVELKFRDESKIFWPSDSEDFLTNDRRQNDKNTEVKNKNNNTRNEGDIFEFRFSDDEFPIWPGVDKNKKNESTNLILSVANYTVKKKPNKVLKSSSKVPLQVITGPDQESESICTFLKKSECLNRNGAVYYKNERGPIKDNYARICCILPISVGNKLPSKIHFEHNSNQTNVVVKRTKRSNKAEKVSTGLKQRYALLMHKYGLQKLSVKPTAPIQTKITQKIVTPDYDYVDPYSNIRNFKLPYLDNGPVQVATKKYEQTDDDYGEDYVMELPTPGLVGLYSDHNGGSPWSFMNGHDGSAYGYDDNDEVNDDENDSTPSFGYGQTVDPRLQHRVVTATFKPSKVTKPSKITHRVVSSEEYSHYDSETQTITLQSNPSFQVLNGFKLVNLMNNKSKISKTEKKITTTENDENDTQESVLIDNDSDDSKDDYNDDQDTSHQVMGNCGKNVVNDDFKSDGNLGETEAGSHPWLALVVLTQKPQTIVCYATIIHPRAAVTTAECVHGRTSCHGEVTVITGVWNLNQDGKEQWQRRMASIYMHEKYLPGELDNNLAVLYWKRPLRLNGKVQQTCLSDPHVGDECRFYGWGGYDQAIRPHPRWQRASILTPRQCSEKLSSKKEVLPNDAFCASVHSRGTVTGAGGALLCASGGRRAVVGVSVWRDNVVILTPARQWTERALRLLIH